MEFSAERGEAREGRLGISHQSTCLLVLDSTNKSVGDKQVS